MASRHCSSYSFSTGLWLQHKVLVADFQGCSDLSGVSETGREPCATSSRENVTVCMRSSWVTKRGPKKVCTRRSLVRRKVERRPVATWHTTACAFFQLSSISHGGCQILFRYFRHSRSTHAICVLDSAHFRYSWDARRSCERPEAHGGAARPATPINEQDHHAFWPSLGHPQSQNRGFLL